MFQIRVTSILSCAFIALSMQVSWAADSSQQPVPDGDAQTKVILVAGATGNQGGAVARELMKRGYQVRGLTRNPGDGSARNPAALGAEIVKGDMQDIASLNRAMAGAYGAFSVQNFWLTDYHGEIQQGKNFVDAAKQQGVQHLVYTSVASADQDTGIPHFESKHVIEQYIKSLQLPYTIIRPVAFMENREYSRDDILRGIWVTPYSLDSRHQWVAVRDIGRFVAEAFDKPEKWLGREIEIAGAEHTLAEVIAVFEHVTGISIEYRQISWEQHEASQGKEMTIMDKWIENTGYSVAVEQLRQNYPWLLNVEDYLKQAGWGPE